MFEIKQRGSTVGREIIGGITTFMSMSYILFVQVGILGSKGELGKIGQPMDDGGILMAMCISAAAASILMGILANYPIALAPGMGENFIFIGFATAMAGWSSSYIGWQMALALTLLVGIIFLLLSTVGFRSRILNAIPDALKSGIAAGIGIFIAVIGLNYSDIPSCLSLTSGGFKGNTVAILSLIGLAVTLALLAFRVRGAILIGILATTAVALLWGKTQWQNPIALPSGLSKTAGGFVPGFVNLFKALPKHWLEILTMAFILLFMDIFDTVGTLVGVAKRANLMKGDHLPNAERALTADAAGTVIGGALGSSTVTSYIESITGVESGARTGLAAVITGICLLAAMFFQPLVKMVMGEFEQGKFPTIAPALIVVGAMMLRAIRDINWDDATEYLPAFLTMIVMPIAMSISAGIAAGFVSYAFGKLITGRVKQCPVIVYIFAILFAIQYGLLLAKI